VNDVGEVVYVVLAFCQLLESLETSQIVEVFVVVEAEQQQGIPPFGLSDHLFLWAKCQL
jgi:hypothetical protein